MKRTITQLPYLINPIGYQSKVLKGTIIIPDISGFSRFVETTDFETGKVIISKLLNAIIKSNTLDLQISEIEGDAVLFFKYGERISAKEILNQFCLMKEVFNQEIGFLEEEFQLNIDLSLKMIAHYGPLAQYNIGKFEKLYGQTVIEAHHLLKNSVESKTYVLLSDELLNSEENSELKNFSQFIENTICEIYDDFKEICYTFFDFENDRCKKCIA
ncbi:DUF2652 domain-containing protein [Zunongwangia endophytica]|uniref:DUF2652 domain-containing protein n=1 Tax=Zunongwangia endophytica TaxID=1808945 RepID=A0ABV8HA22_9FLAO|nr:DUF2652 domain-containing protein [Zunongwangia endophytica]MDN3593750.1 DUF2652 domain-containing protein [Zunongwangia endophytica]